MSEIRLTVNGVARTADVADDDLLLDVLREHAACGSVREGCGVGVCGACTAIVDGTPISTCLALAGRYDGADVLTAEGLDPHDPVVDAFVAAGAMQCGYCTPGFVLMVRDMLERDPDPSEDEIERVLAANTCRCGAYVQIREAVGLAIAARRRHTATADGAREAPAA